MKVRNGKNRYYSGAPEVREGPLFSRRFGDGGNWWYDSGTPEVRMRYADKFVDLGSKIESASFMKAIIKV